MNKMDRPHHINVRTPIFTEQSVVRIVSYLVAKISARKITFATNSTFSRAGAEGRNQVLRFMGRAAARAPPRRACARTVYCDHNLYGTADDGCSTFVITAFKPRHFTAGRFIMLTRAEEQSTRKDKIESKQ